MSDGFLARVMVCVELSRNPYAGVGFLQGLPFPLTSQICAR